MEMNIFSMEFLMALGSIVIIDLVLAGDNAVVIAMASNKLPLDLRKKAIYIGTAGAILIRLAMTFVAIWLLTIPYLQAVGGLFLVPIAVKLLVPSEQAEQVDAAESLMGAVKTIIVADFIMSIDNVLAIAGASAGHFILVVLGLLISIPIVVSGSQLIGKVMERFPVVTYIGAGILGWTSGSMIVHDKVLGDVIAANLGAWSAYGIPAVLAILVCVMGYIKSRKQPET
jgi:YjbE family integral membrane protein